MPLSNDLFTANDKHEKTHPMNSSVAFSNYHNIAVWDPQDPEQSTSNYEIPHRFTLSLGYSHEFLLLQ
jgi:hypothetical protein